MTNILVLAGSTRTRSLNEKLAALVARALTTKGAKVTHISLKEYDMPIYNGDFEETHGIPEAAKKLVDLFHQHQGVFIASPEYNASVSPLLKNTLDWMSRIKSDRESAFANRVFAIGAASISFRGGYRGLTALRTTLELGFNALLIPEMVAVAGAQKLFDDAGDLSEKMYVDQIETCTSSLLKRAKALCL